MTPVSDTPGPLLFVSKHNHAAEHHDGRAAQHQSAEPTAPDAAPELITEFFISLQMMCHYVAADDAPLLGRVLQRSIQRLRKCRSNPSRILLCDDLCVTCYV